ncbi:hypothetical protein DCS_05047 [Drechmeria coniospora]|uniref:Mitochondrial export protein Som1 n=1 Tax=Drechmeria coniospora TaxID=98403 RepID=A0A151GLP9_DRECN|nr:hypothetical protein DCS_05047 [Drechmeria coniospora]KAH8836223.1 hypothetical protein RJ55_10043 [Drechmeria coniospora]KYK58034.1 hypothetical protein DCS_05047 [Drechmeria coniospora]
MTPPCHSFPASELPVKIQQDARGRRRKLDCGARRIDLATCELLQMLQYKCEVQRPLARDSPVQCFAVDRLFRRCKDKNRTFMVETTAWESRMQDPRPPQQQTGQNGQNGQNGQSKGTKPYQWSSNWHDADTAP